MENKKPDVNSLEDLLKVADEFRKWAIDFGNELSKVLADIKAPEEEEDKWEMKCPYKIGDEYYYIYGDGCVRIESWDNFSVEISRWRSGNTFPTKEEAELEAKRRNLLTRFKAFRDECNGNWKADWSDYDKKWSISKDKDELFDTWTMGINTFVTFGYFKNKKDAQRAIELFGDEIKELYVDCEVQ